MTRITERHGRSSVRVRTSSTKTTETRPVRASTQRVAYAVPRLKPSSWIISFLEAAGLTPQSTFGAPDWAKNLAYGGSLGFLGGAWTTLGPVYAAGMLTTAARAGFLPDWLSSMLGVPAEFTYTQRALDYVQSAARYEKNAALIAAVFGDKTSSEGMASLRRAQESYWLFEQATASLRIGWGAARLATFFAPDIAGLRVLGFPFMSAFQRITSAAVMTPQIRVALQYPGVADEISTSPSFWQGQLPTAQEELVGGFGEWTLAQGLAFGGGLRSILGVNMMQFGLGLAMDAISTMTVWRMWGIKPTPEQQTQAGVEIFGGMGLTAVGAATTGRWGGMMANPLTLAGRIGGYLVGTQLGGYVGAQVGQIVGGDEGAQWGRVFGAPIGGFGLSYLAGRGGTAISNVILNIIFSGTAANATSAIFTQGMDIGTGALTLPMRTGAEAIKAFSARTTQEVAGRIIAGESLAPLGAVVSGVATAATVALLASEFVGAFNTVMIETDPMIRQMVLSEMQIRKQRGMPDPLGYTGRDYLLAAIMEYGKVGPAGLPADVLARLQAISIPGIPSRLARTPFGRWGWDIGTIPGAPGTPAMTGLEQFTQFYKASIVKDTDFDVWLRAVAKAGFTLNTLGAFERKFAYTGMAYGMAINDWLAARETYRGLSDVPRFGETISAAERRSIIQREYLVDLATMMGIGGLYKSEKQTLAPIKWGSPLIARHDAMTDSLTYITPTISRQQSYDAWVRHHDYDPLPKAQAKELYADTQAKADALIAKYSTGEMSYADLVVGLVGLGISADRVFSIADTVANDTAYAWRNIQSSTRAQYGSAGPIVGYTKQGYAIHLYETGNYLDQPGVTWYGGAPPTGWRQPPVRSDPGRVNPIEGAVPFTLAHGLTSSWLDPTSGALMFAWADPIIIPAQGGFPSYTIPGKQQWRVGYSVYDADGNYVGSYNSITKKIQPPVGVFDPMTGRRVPASDSSVADPSYNERENPIVPPSWGGVMETTTYRVIRTLIAKRVLLPTPSRWDYVTTASAVNRQWTPWANKYYDEGSK